MRRFAASLLFGALLAACGSAAAPASAPNSISPAGGEGQGEGGVSSAAPRGPATTSAKPAASGQATVHVAFSGAGTDASLFIGVDKGYFAEQGIAIDNVRLNSSDMPPQLASGALDVGAGSFTVSLINAIQRGLDLRLVADKARCLPGSGALQIVVRKDLYDSGKVRGPADFKGLTFGIQSVGSGNEVELDQFLKKGGLGINDVTRKPLTYPDMPVAFSNKSIDATSAPEPTPSQLVHDNLAVSVGKCGDYNPNGEISMILYGPKFISDRPDVAKRFMVGYLKAVRYFNDAFARHNPQVLDEAIGLIARDTKVDPKVYQDMNAGNSMWGIDPNGQLNTASFQTDQDFWLHVTGELKQGIDLGKLVDMSYASAAVQQLGPYK